MKKFRLLLLLILASQISLVSCSSDNNDSPSEMSDDEPEPLAAETRLNVSYGSHQQQVYDLYLPEGRTEDHTKVIILVHGGGWTAGDKADMSEFIPQLQSNHPEHAIVNMNYVLATATIPAFPNQFLDLQRVINKLTAEKETLQILPEFGLIGTSAGAHLSLQYDYVYDTSDAVKMVCDIVGPTDFTDPFYTNDPNFSILLQILVDEAAYPTGTNYAEAISPALQVSAVSSPSILFYGDQDPLVPLSNGQTLQQALITNGVTHSFTVYEGGHGDDWSAESLSDLQLQLSTFINAHLAIE
jgi:acetyl esterase/lipase